MTRQRNLKRRIRERMARTGERYTTARAHVLPSPERSGARSAFHHGETALLSALLARAGVNDPATGAPFGEALLLGIGGGLGGAYFVFEYAGELPTLYVGTRVGHQVPYTADFSRGVLERLGQTARVSETGGAKAAAKGLDELLADGRSALVWADRASLSWSGMPAMWQGHWPEILLVGEDGEHVVRQEGGRTLVPVWCLAERPYLVERGELDRARGRYRKAKHRLITLAPTAAEREPDVGAAARAGVATCIQSLRDGALVKGFGGNFGLAALAKWASLVDDGRNKKGWRRVFASPPGLLRGLGELYRWVETAGTGGGAFRPLYAEFLGTIGERLGARRGAPWRAAADVYAELGRAWSALAGRALDPEVEPFARLRAVLEEEESLWREGGDDTAARAQDLRERRTELEARAARDGLGLDEPAIDAIHTALGEHLTELVELEGEAVELLEPLAEG